MREAHKERLWFLKGWAGSGWRQNMRRGKKWEAHIAYLLKHGLLEEGPGAMACMYRITDAGEIALNSQDPAS